MSRFALTLVAVLCAMVLFGFITVQVFPFGSARSLAVTPSQIGGVLDWATKRGVKAGTVQSLTVPASLTGFGVSARATVVHLQDGRYCVLVKTAIGYKDNFEGVLSCTGPLLRSEIEPAHGTYGSYVSLTNCSLPGCGVFEELYIRRARGEQTFDVYFDLN